MAKGPGGHSVGRVSVRVLPDTSRFREELRAQLAGIEKGLKIKIPVEVESSAFEKQFAKFKSEMSGVNIRPNLDVSGIDKAAVAAKNMQADLKRSADNVREMSANVSKFTATVRNVRQHWQDVDNSVNRVSTGVKNVDHDVSRTVRSVVRLGRGFTRLGNVAGKAGLEAASGIGAMINSAVTAAPLLKGIGSAASSAVEGVSNMSRGFLIFVAVLALAAPLLGLIATLLASLPALAFAFLAPVAAIALGFEGIKKAAAPLGPLVEKLKKSLSDAFAKSLTPVFKQLAKVFPVLQAGLLALVPGITAIAQAFTNVITSAKGLTQIGVLLNNVGTFLTSIAPGIAQMTDAFLTLASEGSKSFGQLAGFLNGFFTQFNNIVQQVSSNGLLGAAIAGMTKVVSALGTVFNQLFLAGLQVMTQIGGPFSQLIIAFGNALVSLTPFLVTISNLISNVLGAALTALVPVLDALAGPFATIANILGTVLIGAIQAVAPVLTVIAANFATLVSILAGALAPLLPTIIGFFTQLGQILATHIASAFNAIVPLLNLAADMFFQLFVALEPLLPKLLDLATALSGAFITALTALVPAIIELAQKVFPLIIDAVIQLMPSIMDLIDALVKILPPITQIIVLIIGALIPVFNLILTVITAVFPTIVAIIKGAIDIIVNVIRFFIAVFSGQWKALWEGLKVVVTTAFNNVKDGVSQGIEGFLVLVQRTPERILQAIGNLKNLLFKKGEEIIQGLVDGVKAAIGKAKSVISGVVSALNPFDLLGPMDLGGITPPTIGVPDTSGAMTALGSIGSAMQGLSGGLDLGIPAAVAGLGDVKSSAKISASSAFDAHIDSDNFGGDIAGQIHAALKEWSVQIDADGLAKTVNKANNRRARR